MRRRAAISVAREVGVSLEKADAAVWTAKHGKPKRRMATVLHQSVFWQYPPEDTRVAIRGAVEAAGAAATPDGPFAWLRMEPDPGNPSARMEVRLTLWRKVESASLLASTPMATVWKGWREPESSPNLCTGAA